MAASDTDNDAAFLVGLPAPEAIAGNGFGEFSTEKAALDTLVARYTQGHFTISGSRYFRVDATIRWPQLSTYVYSKLQKGDGPIKPGGRPAYPAWAPPSPADQPGIFMLIDAYPSENTAPDFLISMAREPLPDGTSLVGYFILEPTPQ